MAGFIALGGVRSGLAVLMASRFLLGVRFSVGSLLGYLEDA
jgi:hypothetical protein